METKTIDTKVAEQCVWKHVAEKTILEKKELNYELKKCYKKCNGYDRYCKYYEGWKN